MANVLFIKIVPENCRGCRRCEVVWKNPWGQEKSLGSDLNIDI
jgi:hypothetical protein